MDEAKQDHAVGVSHNNPQHGDGSDTVHTLEGARSGLEGQEPTGVGVDGEADE